MHFNATVATNPGSPLPLSCWKRGDFPTLEAFVDMATKCVLRKKPLQWIPGGKTYDTALSGLVLYSLPHDTAPSGLVLYGLPHDTAPSGLVLYDHW